MEMKCLHASMFAWMCHLDLFTVGSLTLCFFTIYIYRDGSGIARSKGLLLDHRG